MKIFELTWPDGQKEWIAAHSNVAAAVGYAELTGNASRDLGSFHLEEVPEDDWNNHIIKNDDGTTITFKDWMVENLPVEIELIAGTMY